MTMKYKTVDELQTMRADILAIAALHTQLVKTMETLARRVERLEEVAFRENHKPIKFGPTGVIHSEEGT